MFLKLLLVWTKYLNEIELSYEMTFERVSLSNRIMSLSAGASVGVVFVYGLCLEAQDLASNLSNITSNNPNLESAISDPVQTVGIGIVNVLAYSISSYMWPKITYNFIKNHLYNVQKNIPLTVEEALSERNSNLSNED